jgi:hypothetical protein
MSIVDIDLGSSSIGYLLETTWDTGELCDERLDSRYIDLLGHEDRDSTEDIRYVEVARQSRAQVKHIRWDTDIKLSRHLCIGHVFGSDLGRWRESYGIEIVHDDITREKPVSIWTIDIDDSDLAGSFFDTVLVQIAKKLQLGVYIVVHRLVQIEMILGDIGQYSCIIAESMDTMIVESV